MSSRSGLRRTLVMLVLSSTVLPALLTRVSASAALIDPYAPLSLQTPIDAVGKIVCGVGALSPSSFCAASSHPGDSEWTWSGTWTVWNHYGQKLFSFSVDAAWWANINANRIDAVQYFYCGNTPIKPGVSVRWDCQPTVYTGNTGTSWLPWRDAYGFENVCAGTKWLYWRGIQGAQITARGQITGTVYDEDHLVPCP